MLDIWTNLPMLRGWRIWRRIRPQLQGVEGRTRLRRMAIGLHPAGWWVQIVDSARCDRQAAIPEAIASRDHVAGPKPECETGLLGGEEKRAIVVVPYRSEWPRLFRMHAARISAALGDAVLQIEHIGSTAVPGLAAKPIIDILVVVEDSGKENAYLPAMTGCGYELRVREPEFHEHRMFRTTDRGVHVHVLSRNSPEIGRYLRFRDSLRGKAAYRTQYQVLKQTLSEQDWPDLNAYAAAKSELIEAILRASRSD